MKQPFQDKRRLCFGVFLGLLLAVASGAVIVDLRRTRAEEERGRQLFEVIFGINNSIQIGTEGEAAREIVERHAAAITTLHSLVVQRCRIPPEVASIPDDGTRARQFYLPVQAANLLSLAALEAESQRRFPEAAELWIDRIRMGQLAGGGRAFRSVGTICMVGGWSGLHRLADRLNAEQSRTVLNSAATLWADPPTGRSIAIRDARDAWWQVWNKPAFWAPGGNRVAEGMRRARQAFEHSPGSWQWDKNLLSGPRERALVNLALRAFVLEQGRRPTNLTEVVPAYLPTPPESSSLRAKLVAE